MSVFRVPNGNMGCYDYYFECDECAKIVIIISNTSHNDLEKIKLVMANNKFQKFCCSYVDMSDFIHDNAYFNYDSYQTESVENGKFDRLLHFQRKKRKDYTNIIKYTKDYLYFGIDRIYNCTKNNNFWR